MTKLSFLIILCIYCNVLHAQDTIGFVDIHVHTTLMNYTKFVYNPEDVPLNNTGQEIFNKNWRSNPFCKKKEKTSNLRKTQSDYSTISKGGYSIVCGSIATAEKAHLDHWVKRLLAWLGGFNCKRMKRRISPSNTSFEYFMSEYRFQTRQNTNFNSMQDIEVAKNGTDLTRIIYDHKIPIVLTVEGLNALMGDFLAQDKHFKDISHAQGNTAAYDSDYNAIRTELLQNLDVMKNLDHRILFVSPTHHNWDYIAGQARYFDKNEKLVGLGVRKIIIHILTPRRGGKRSFGNKNGTGIIDTLHQKHNTESREQFTDKYGRGGKTPSDNRCNCPSGRDNEVNSICWDKDHIMRVDIGRPIFASLLDANNKHHKRIYIDVKHMDIQSRIDYYKLLEEYKAKGINIPIIASHTGVSGKDFLMAYHTGLPPLFDDYREIDNSYFYTENAKFRDIENCNRELTESYKSCKEDIGWFYPLSLNLYKEEIKTIYDSDGLIGIILDERLLGAYAYNYKRNSYRKSLNAFCDKEAYTKQQKKTFKELIPFFRNLVYLVSNSGRHDITAWDHVCIGSDYDGLVDPIDVCLTSAEMPKFENLCINYFDDYLRFQNISEEKLFLDSMTISTAMKKVFRANAYNFILKYF